MIQSWSSSGGYSVISSDGTKRPMTEVEILRWEYPLPSSLDILQEWDDAQTDVLRCDRCNRPHPDIHPAPIRTMYAEGPQPQPALCPECTEEWNEYWADMWADYYGGLL